MPHSDEPARREPAVTGQNLAVLAESLYVINLLLLPFIAFLVLVFVFLKQRRSAPPLARSHLEQTVSASIGIAVMFFLCAIIILLLKALGLENVALWIIVVIVFTIIHATMVLFGVFGLAKAMAGKCWRYPVFGARLPADCPR